MHLINMLNIYRGICQEVIQKTTNQAKNIEMVGNLLSIYT
ncbi:MAG: hypothetical protein ACJAXJ_002378 [Colwellia sp.]|jgi:hypothetical protein